MRYPYAKIETLFFCCPHSFDYMVDIDTDYDGLAVYYMWDGIT